MAGLPAPEGYLPIENPQTVITIVLPGSPAEEAGLLPGDAILALNGAPVTPEEATQAIGLATAALDFEVSRGEDVSHKFVTPREGVVTGQRAVGISMEVVGTAKLGPARAFGEGMRMSARFLVETAQALGSFLSQAVVGRADLSSVSGPVGLVGMVGEARELGWGYLLFFTAIISVNLSLINLMPFPALDGGRLLFVGIEAVSRRRIPAKIYHVVNTVGFALLIALMLVITVHDIRGIL
jgi:regulator of sigma E protease